MKNIIFTKNIEIWMNSSIKFGVPITNWIMSGISRKHNTSEKAIIGTL